VFILGKISLDFKFSRLLGAFLDLGLDFLE
jgi:hypothetical protein